MKTIKQNPLLIKSVFAGLLLLFASSCEKLESIDPSVPHGDSEHHSSTKTTSHFGPSVPVGGGVARIKVEVNKSGEPLSFAIVLSEKVLTDLPHEMASVVLALPKQAELTPFDHVTLDWNPHGHEPDNIYTHPHFDFHFYTISEEEREKIGLNDPEGELLPDPKYLPATYIPLPGSIPMMGKHWVDPYSPELNGTEFTQTFLWGTYNKVVTFLEPMITLDYLLSQPNKSFEILQPAEYQQTGKYYPGSYRIDYDGKKKEYLISLNEFTKRS